VFPVNYRLHAGTIVFRTAQDSPTDEDLRTGIAHAEYKVAFEIDEIDLAAREGWSVLVQGPVHHVESDSVRAEVLEADVETWAGRGQGAVPPRRPEPGHRTTHWTAPTSVLCTRPGTSAFSTTGQPSRAAALTAASSLVTGSVLTSVIP
jgi:nitroimidazol reductase NimA-like FMN-containing flavoprotein (pyridoxamine 5'-phosphate oxidase superfamily)